MRPTSSPPAPSFASIAQRTGTTEKSLQHFLNKTHHGLDIPKDMPAPMLADFQIAAITAYRSIRESNRKGGCNRFIGIEYYADYGKIGNVLPLPKQSQHTDFKVKDVEAEFGAGYGFTPGSDQLIFKAIIGYAFPSARQGKQRFCRPIELFDDNGRAARLYVM